ncbi:hypothetical protein [Xanthomonas arboricola]|uniref:hypothetical protein n=2 Tax=Xanthomonas arboricola TaxID=56448 RepID=UPI0016A3CB60|nr:hypothetical protein [Xanthomonas arboricola]MBB6573454.1 hypothetical protein [Xanthomonas arboricola]
MLEKTPACVSHVGWRDGPTGTGYARGVHAGTLRRTGMLRLVCLAFLVCASLPLAAQQKTQPTVLFPSGNYAPQPTAPVPFAEKKPLKPSDTATRFNGPSAMERCIAQCNRRAAQCAADRPSESSCRMAVAPRGKSCDAIQNPAQRANCMAKVFDCTQQSDVNRCEPRKLACLRSCTN